MTLVWPCGLTIHKNNLLVDLSQGTSDVLILGTPKLCKMLYKRLFHKTDFIAFFVRSVSAKSSTYDDLLIFDTVSHSFSFNANIFMASVYPNRQILHNCLTIVFIYIHRVRKRLYPFFSFFPRCPLCGAWCKLH